MSGFSADWLSLREPADTCARADEIRDAAISVLSGKTHPVIVDLASGTGSTLRALSPHLPKGQSWRLIDHDPALLKRAEALCANLIDADHLECLEADLAGNMDSVLDRAFEGADLVTTSAFLDLVSKPWAEAFLAKLLECGLPFYAALTYDGRTSCTPVHPLDQQVVDAVNLHQTSDKGFGPALGPHAAEFVLGALRGAGCQVMDAPSDWTCREEDPIFQSELVDGWANAARETEALSPADLDRWHSFRSQAITAKKSQILVGHVDLFAIPVRMTSRQRV
ncbi:class I SAM-dependent methyltransferase [Breoghania sp.]|uniref:class I SAM-dependent methyltransferase n=1 Tax=Breoghania sp. TaxID=2065378 RepID=UPI002AAB3868|nr:class I SAM-dependent methyltransferase [Breoghania sp.]